LLGFAVGFVVESVADWQKWEFKRSSQGRGNFCSKGLWSISRHPNYLGELMIWISLFFLAAPGLEGISRTTLAAVSPAFISLLLLKVSGIPIAESRAEERFAGREDYEAYKANTPVLMPRLFSLIPFTK